MQPPLYGEGGGEALDMSNLVLRTLTGIVFVAVLVGGIVYNAYTFGALFCVITILSVAEFCRIVNAKDDVQTNTMIASLSGGLLFGAFYCYNQGLCNAAIFLPYLASLIYLLVLELYLKRPNPINNWAYTMMSQMYVALPFSMLNMLAFNTDPGHPFMIVYRWILPLSVFIFLWASDSGAYCVGSMLHNVFPAKLFPRISPKKSWIGSIGGGLIAMGAAALIYQWDQTLTLPQWMGFALVVTIFGTWGDLVESLIKRTLGIKDSGNILPGHGGMLDRFDSSLLAIPASVIYLYSLQMM